MRIISDDGHQVSARAISVVRHVSTAESRTERLRVLLTASTSRHCLTCTYLIQPSLMYAGFSNKFFFFFFLFFSFFLYNNYIYKTKYPKLVEDIV